MIEFVSATRATTAEYQKTYPLAISLGRLGYNPTITARVTVENRIGLSEIYNRAIDADSDADIVVFIHDDIWIDDYFIGQRVIEGLKYFDVIGIAGTRRRVPLQPAWAFAREIGVFDTEYLSGAVGHSCPPPAPVSYYGPAPAPCELLDGVFLAARRSTLRRSGVRFDPQFKFHFYDLDFCRTARSVGLNIGTWPIAITHESPGLFGSESWRAGYDLYIQKWGS